MEKNEFISKILPMKDKLYRLARRLLKISEEAEDAVQDTMLRLWARRGELDQCRSTEAYAVTVTRNICLDRLKSAAKKYMTEEQDMVIMENRSSVRANGYNDINDIISCIVDSLPERQKTAFQLRDIEQMEFEEIAAITGSSIANVRVQVSRARKSIKNILINQYNYQHEN